MLGFVFMYFCRVLSRQISNFPEIVLVDLLTECTRLKFSKKCVGSNIIAFLVKKLYCRSLLTTLAMDHFIEHSIYNSKKLQHKFILYFCCSKDFGINLAN